MQIKKINNNKLKVILNLNDLNNKNIDIDSFLSNSLESQDFFFEILDLAEEQYDFNIENTKAVVEAISLDNNIFILTITKLKNNFPITYNNSNQVYLFETVENLLEFLSTIKKHKLSIKNNKLYEYNNYYYFILNDNNAVLENILIEYSNVINNSNIINSFLFEYGNKIKNFTY